MKVHVVSGRELASDHRWIWSQIQRSDPALRSPYFCPEYTLAVASVRRDVYVGVLEEGTKVVGFFPFQRDPGRVGRPVGGPLSDYQGLIVANGVDWNAKDLIRGCGLVLWEFDHLIVSQQQFKPYYRTVTKSPIMDLSKGYVSYADGRRKEGSTQILKIGTLRRKLVREVGPLRYEAHTADTVVLDQLLRWKSKQYVQSGLTDVFRFGWTVRLLKRLHATQTDDFAGVLSALYVGERLITAHLGMRSRNVWHYWFPAYDRAFRKFSPGLILLLKMAESAESLGVKVVDLGKGMSIYKERLMSGSIPIAEGCVELPSVVSIMRRTRSRAESWLRRTPLVHVAKIPGRVLRRFEASRRFR